jgi:hypothetical protein
MTFPTIFDLLERFSYLRGIPAATVVLLAAVIIIVVQDWRLSLLALAVQYLFAGLLFVDLLDPRLAIVKVLVGLFVCMILYLTARQVNWGRLPVDVTEAEVAQLNRERRVRVGAYVLPTTTPFRVFVALMMALVVVTLSQRPGYQLPAVPESLGYLNLAVYALAGLGLLTLALTAEPLQAGMGVFMFLSGFELFYSALEQSIGMLAALAAVNLVVALVIAYLTQARHALPALLD